LSKKHLKERAMALITVLSIMVILLILSFAIVNLATGNLKTAGNINARFHALNLANSASMYAIYEIQTCCEPDGFLWAPGAMPTPVSGMTFTVYDPIPESKLNGLSGRCSVAYINNLDNPNPNIAVSPGGTFSSLLGPTVDIPEEGTVIFAQGEYDGFKRTIQIILKQTYYGSAIDGTLILGDGKLMLNGIEDIFTIAPCSGSLYAKKNIVYNGVTGFKFFNGSKLISSGTITNGGGGIDIPSIFLEENRPSIPLVKDWNIGDPAVTAGDPNDTDIYAHPVYPDEPSGMTIIKRPSFDTADGHPSPDLLDNRRYICNNLTISNNTFVNGSLHVTGYLSVENNSCLFVNGVLTVEIIGSYSKGTIFVAGYNGDTGNPDYGLAMEITKLSGVTRGLHGDVNPDGFAIFTDGDIRLSNTAITVDPVYDDCLSSCPIDVEKILNVHRVLGYKQRGEPSPSEWYTWIVASVNTPPLLYIPGYDGTDITIGYANEEMITMGLEPVPEEYSQWIIDGALAPDIEDWIASNQTLFDTWRLNPSIYQYTNDYFLPAVIYTHGTLSTEGTTGPIRIVGGVIGRDTVGISPNPTGDPNDTHGGNITLTKGSSIILCPELFENRSGKNIISPILTVYSWQELF